MAAAAFAALSFSACDEVDEADRFIELPKLETSRNILVEEFTGQQCTNCPDAHRALAGLSELYGSNMIVVGIHAGSFGIAEGLSPTITGLMQPEGNEYANHWGNLDGIGYPIAVINRRGGAIPFNSGAWPATIRTELTRKAQLDIELSARINAANEIEVNTTLKSYADINAKLQLWVVEDNISAFQIDNGKVILDYKHNHVYRASINGTWGEDVALKDQGTLNKTATIKVRDNWNTDNLHIVAFVYSDAEGVMQAQKTKAIKKSNEE